MGLAEVRWASLCRLGLQPHRRTQRQALPPLDWPVCQLRQLLCTDAQALACKPQCPQQMVRSGARVLAPRFRSLRAPTSPRPPERLGDPRSVQRGWGHCTLDLTSLVSAQKGCYDCGSRSGGIDGLSAQARSPFDQGCAP